MYIHLAFYRCVKHRILCRCVAAKHAVFHSSFRRIATHSIYLSTSLMYWLLQYCSKVSYPPPRKTRLVSVDSRLEKRDESRYLRVHWKYQHFAFVGIRNWFCVFRRMYRIVSICAVNTIFILISDACVPSVYYKFSTAIKIFSLTLPKRFFIEVRFSQRYLLQVHVHHKS